MFFLFLEVVSIWLIVSYNRYQSAVFFNSSSFIAGEILAARSNVTEYFDLKDMSSQLANQNATLLSKIHALQQQASVDSVWHEDTVSQFKYTPAKVINNSLSLQTDNYITLNKGAKDGIRPDMGVIGPDGIVGKVKNTSENFSTVTSLLSGMSIASKIRDKNIDATVKWPGKHPRRAELKYVMRHHKPEPGDTVVTSEYNAIFPAGVLIGVITEVNLPQGSADYEITVELATDFSALSYVYVVENSLKPERDSLEALLQNQK